MSSPAIRHESRTGALTEAQLGQLREMLEQLHSFRRDQIAQLRTELPAAGPDTEIHDSLLEGARAALHDVIDALDRMSDGSYGACVDCSRALPVERLMVLPQASLCMDCQHALEI